MPNTNLEKLIIVGYNIIEGDKKVSLIKVTLESEEQKLKKLIVSYEDRLLSLPKGSIIAKKRNNNTYFYLSYRRDNKVISEYIGKDKNKIDQVEQKLAKRVHTVNMIKRLQKELMLINKLKESV